MPVFRVKQKVKALKNNGLVKIGLAGVVYSAGINDSWIDFGEGVGKWWIKNEYLQPDDSKMKESKRFKIKYLYGNEAKEVTKSEKSFFHTLVSLELDKEVKEIKVEIINEEVRA